MEVTLTEVLTIYGPLGVLALVGLSAATHMFRVVQAERKTSQEQLNKLTSEHKAEMQAMVDRYIQTATTQIEQYHNLAEKLHGVVESIGRRLDRREGP
jgi:hypothetical protein